MAGRLTLLVSSPRVPAGVLTRDAWGALEHAALVAGRPDEPQVHGIHEAGIPVTNLPEQSATELARALVTEAATGGGRLVVWVGSSDGDAGLTDAVAAEVTRMQDPPEVEMVLGSFDLPGARLLDLVAVMDRLRSPGGCRWDAEQTHESLVPHLLEEAHEAAEALESGDRAHMVEELGDVLLQVAFHARVAEEHESEPFGIDDVAAGIVEKLVRRHPHVFADADADSAASVALSWEAIKGEERAAKAAHQAATPGVLHGIPVSMPTLARAAKVVDRLDAAGLGDVVDEESGVADPGPRLLALVAELRRGGADPDAALRSVLRALAERVVGRGNAMSR